MIINIVLKLINNIYSKPLESELVSGFMTEHAAVIFVFFFLAEYASIVLICILTSILFLGGYLSPIDLSSLHLESYLFFPVFITFISGLMPSIILGIKSSFLIFVFI